MAVAAKRVYRIPIGTWAFVRETSTRCTTRITSSATACEHVKAYFAECPNTFQERFSILTLDTKHKPIAWHTITVGVLDASLVHPREVFRPAILDGAAAVLLCHNHPSGDVTPSREDLAVTDRLTDAGKLIGITVLDHIVYGDDSGEARSVRDSQ